MNAVQGRAVIREYAKELDAAELGEQFISDGESLNDGEGGEYFWRENFANPQQVKDAFFEDYYSPNDEDLNYGGGEDPDED